MGNKETGLQEFSFNELCQRIEAALNSNNRMNNEREKVVTYLVLGGEERLAELDEGFNLRNMIKEIRERVLK
jgi:hypothetical protein